MPYLPKRHIAFKPEFELHVADPDRGWYSNKRWLKVRRMALARNPLCANPWFTHRPGETVPATDVDHIVPRRERPDLAYRLANLRGLCHACHSRVTRGAQVEQMKRVRPKPYT